MKYVVLYNPYANNGKGREKVEMLALSYYSDRFDFVDITTVTDYEKFFFELPLETSVVVCGGDGTLNRFINDTKSIDFKHGLYYFPCGSGNDFARDLGFPEGLVPLSDYIQNLPVVCVSGKEKKFINGVGYGIDGYCCEEGDKLRAKKAKVSINYTKIAVKGLLFDYKPTQATVIVDGEEYLFKKVWIAPTMYGKYYGGGMMPTPNQSRNNLNGTLSVMVFHGCGKLKTLSIFPSIFKGEHIKKKKNVTVLTGNKITVKFDSPRALQIDGETVKNVTEYTVKSA